MPPRILYTADLHIGHANVLKFDNRPFGSIEEMNRVIIENWQATVNQDDTIYILGDVFYRTKENPAKILNNLPGHKYLIVGNHDNMILSNDAAKRCFESIDKIVRINDSGRTVVLCHYPMAEWDQMYRGSYHVFGHIHNNPNEACMFMAKKEKALNAGCMVNGYVPVSLDTLISNNARRREELLTQGDAYKRG